MPYGYDERMGVDRYQLMHDFFDRYLKVEDKLPPVVLVVSPRDNKEDVSPATQIIVDFAPVIDPESIINEKGIKYAQKIIMKWTEPGKCPIGGQDIPFTPAKVLNNNEQYGIIVSTKVKDKAGTQLDKEKIFHFTVASEH